MEVKIERDNISLKYKLKRGETYKVSNTSKYKSVTIMKKPKLVAGFSNVCQDGKAILVLDYDNVDKEVVLEDYMSIQMMYKLPPGYLFQTSENSYHVICLRKLWQGQIYNILSFTRCDEAFKTMPLRNPYRSYVLRMSDKGKSEKPKFIGKIGILGYLRYEVSSAHLKLLEKLYKIPEIEYQTEDKLNQIKLQYYQTNG